MTDLWGREIHLLSLQILGELRKLNGINSGQPPLVRVRQVTSAGPGEMYYFAKPFGPTPTVIVSERDLSLLKEVINASAEYIGCCRMEEADRWLKNPKSLHDPTPSVRQQELRSSLSAAVERFQAG